VEMFSASYKKKKKRTHMTKRLLELDE